MLPDLLRLFRHTLSYGVGHVLTRVVAFLMLPVFTHELKPGDYAMYALFYLGVAVTLEVARMGLDVALLRFYVPEKDAFKRAEVFSTVWWTALVVTAIVTLPIMLAPRFWLGLLISSVTVHPDWMIYTLKLSVAILWLDNLAAFPLVVMRGENQPLRFTTIRVSGALIQVVMTLLLLGVRGRGVAGIFEANVISSAAILLFCLPSLKGRLKMRFDRAMFGACLAFGLPNLPNALFVQVIELADRKIIELFRSPEEVGIYAAGYRLGMFLAIVAMGFRYAWQPFFLQMADSPNARQVFARVLTWYLALVGWLYLVLVFCIPPILKFDLPLIGPLIAPEYWDGLRIFPVVLLAHVFNGVWAILMVGIYLHKKMHVLPLMTGIAAAVNVAGNLLLIPAYGMWAAAWLTVLSYALVAVMLYIYVNRVYPVAYEWKHIARIFATGTAVFAAGWYAASVNLHWPGYILSFLFPLFLFAAGVMSLDELQWIKDRARRSIR